MPRYPLPAGGELWKDEEDALVRRLYPTLGAVGLQPQLPRRTLDAIRHRANDLGVRCKPGWSERDERRLVYLWGDAKTGLNGMAAYFGRTPQAVFSHAVRLGLAVGCPPGFEYLTAASSRCNFELKTMRRILAWAGVTVHDSLSTPSLPRGRYRRSYVDPDTVDAAVARWLDAETVRAAALARGIGYKLIYRWLVDAGVIETTDNNTAWRIPSAVIDRVVALHRPVTETRSAA